MLARWSRPTRSARVNSFQREAAGSSSRSSAMVADWATVMSLSTPRVPRMNPAVKSPVISMPGR